METVVLIYEDNHGVIGVAEDYESALKFLLDDHWINDSTEIYLGFDGHTYRWKTILEDLGEDWRDKMMEWDISKFNDYFGGFFDLSIEEVIWN